MVCFLCRKCLLVKIFCSEGIADLYGGDGNQFKLLGTHAGEASVPFSVLLLIMGSTLKGKNLLP